MKNLLHKRISEKIKNKAKEEKEEFLTMLLGTLCASLLVNLISRKGVIRVGKGTTRAGQYFQHKLII